MAKKWTEQQVKRFKEIYPTSTVEEILQDFPWMNSHSINERARKLGVRKSKSVCLQRRGDLTSLASETNEAYYWMGMIMADGWISKTGQVVLTLSENDEDHLQKFADFVGSRVGNMQRNMKRVAVSHPEVAEKLVQDFGMKPRKTYNPPDLPIDDWTDEQFLSFFAGFVDGDGSIYMTAQKRLGFKIQIHGSWLKILKHMQERLCDILRIDYANLFCGPSNRKDKNACEIRTGNQQLIRNIASIINSLNLPLMKRKWSKAI